VTPVSWVKARDRNFVALRRAGRTAIVMPALFAFGDKVIGNATVATFAAFGSFALLLLVDFGGPIRARLQAQAALAVTGAVFICLGTPVSLHPWAAAAVMAVVGFGVLFAGVVSSVLAGASTALLLSMILPVTLAGSASTIPDRLAGWGIASVVSLAAIALLWPAPARDPLRAPASAACRALAARLRSDVEFVLSGGQRPDPAGRATVIADAEAAAAAVQGAFLATPYRPTGLSTTARMIVRLVDELKWLDAIIGQSAPVRPPGGSGPIKLDPMGRGACAVKLAAAGVLEVGADRLDGRAGTGAADDLPGRLAELETALASMEDWAGDDLPVHRRVTDLAEDSGVTEFLSALEPTFRARELSFVAAQLAANIDLAAAAEQRSWLAGLLGRRPDGVASTFSAAQERAAAHVERHSVWLHNSIRGAVGLGLAVLVADLSGTQHSFWVVLGTLSVLRSNALSTGQNVLRGLLGTVAGFVVGALLLWAVGTDTTVLWVLLPVAVLVAGFAPAVISFAAGQAAFTVTLVVLYNIIAPAGWHVGLLRVEDIALGCVISLVVGLLFWPRGAGAALGLALAEAYTDSSRYLDAAVRFGVAHCDVSITAPPAPADEALRSAAAARRLDDTFRAYLAERGAKPIPLAEVAGLVTGVVGLRLAADAVLDLWRRGGSPAGEDRADARAQLLATSHRLTGWYEDLAAGLAGTGPVPDPLPNDDAADGRLIDAIRRDLRGPDGRASRTAVRMIWTGDHLDAARRLQADLVEPTRAAVRARTQAPLDLGSWRPSGRTAPVLAAGRE
jgi:uncharacterized membrane protein YccC